MICPKCGFDQPDDIFCASCGVDVKQYSPSFKTSIRKNTVAFVVIALLLAGFSIMFYPKFVSFMNLDRIFPEGQITDSGNTSTFGVSSELEGTAVERTAAPVAATAPAPRVDAVIAPVKAPDTVDARPVTTVFMIGEISTVEINQLLVVKDHPIEPEGIIWGRANDIPLIRRAYIDREMRIKGGENKFNYADEFVRFDITIDVKSQDQQGFKATFNYTRRYDNSLQVIDGNAQSKFDITVPYQSLVYIIDKLPRLQEGVERILPSNSLISQLHKSSTFLNDTSESVFVFQFENPYK